MPELGHIANSQYEGAMLPMTPAMQGLKFPASKINAGRMRFVRMVALRAGKLTSPYSKNHAGEFAVDICARPDRSLSQVFEDAF